MSNQDWRNLIKQWDREGTVKHVTEEVKKEYEISTLMIELEKQKKYPIMIFDNVENNEYLLSQTYSEHVKDLLRLWVLKVKMLQKNMLNV